MTKAMLIDVSKCTACRACQVACKAWNDLPGEITVCLGCYDNPPDLSPDTWNRIAFWEVADADGNLQDWAFRPVRCMHCADAPCVRVCPTGALSKNPMGFTAYGESKCNGCGYCTQFCPYDIPRLKEADVWGKGKTTKCTFCQDRTTNGLVPACAQTCPTGAIVFGERDEMVALGRQRVEELKAKGRSEARLYGETELGGLHQMYVLDAAASAYGLPESPTYPTGASLRNVLKPVGNIAIGAALVGSVAAFFITRRNIRMEEVE